MKNNAFNWAWNSYAPLPDPLMTRQRAARLLRAWRRLVRQPANYRPITSLGRLEPGVYRVTHESGEVGTLYTPRAKI